MKFLINLKIFSNEGRQAHLNFSHLINIFILDFICLQMITENVLLPHIKGLLWIYAHQKGTAAHVSMVRYLANSLVRVQNIIPQLQQLTAYRLLPHSSRLKLIDIFLIYFSSPFFLFVCFIPEDHKRMLEKTKV